MKKTENVMIPAMSKSRLSIYNSGVFDEAGGEIVISCGYTNGGKFGYFVCKEHLDPHTKVYEYTSQLAFYLKENENTYPLVLKELNELLESSSGEV